MCQIPNNPIRLNIQNEILRDYVIPIGLSTGLSAVANGCIRGAFGVTPLVGGAIFGATAITANFVAAKILGAWSVNDEARVNLTLFLMIPLFFASVAAATAVTTMAGFPMTWMAVAACAAAVFASYVITINIT